ncbi:hypothetical protein CASFOL_001354 [Castilleja foliolosa]|uniref:Uncharacterized protein n=1 Tax=Castilleja foliolosa TaxID=1961234 RepID=A0ABD3EMA3_9LAMI
MKMRNSKFTFGQEEREIRKATRVEEAFGGDLFMRFYDVVLMQREMQRRRLVGLRNKQRRDNFPGDKRFRALLFNRIRVGVDCLVKDSGHQRNSGAD